MGLFGKIQAKKRAREIEEALKTITVNGVPLFDDDYVFGQHEETSYGSDELDEYGELPIGWIGRHHEELRNMEENVVAHVKAAQDTSKPVDERIEEYETAIRLYGRMKERFVSKGECYAKYFSDMWENCHNSKCEIYKYIDPVAEELTQLRENYDTLKRREAILSTLDANLFQYIKSEGKVLQTDIYKAFDPVVKTDIMNILYQWAKEGRINREKSGRSYLVSLTVH